MQESNQPALNPAQINFLQAQLRAHNQLKGGANWFWWIAGLSLVNSLIALSGSTWNFVIGLGVTQFIDAVVHALVAKTASGVGITLTIVGLIMDLGVLGLFALFGFLAKKGYKWAFIVGMALYALDAVIFVFVGGWLSVGFHVFALFGLYNGLKAINQLKQLQQVATPSV